MASEIRLELEGLRKNFGETTALDGFSLKVRAGEIVGMIGPDAAGKTTAMRIACGLLLPDEGEAKVMDFSTRDQFREIKEHIGYMPQRFSLWPDLTVTENLRFFADMYLVPRSERIKRETRLMEFSRLEPFRNRRAGALSGGMKQKLALSCTLIHTPDLLILDEPTTGVDPVSRKEFWEILRSLVDDGIAILVSTPYMDEAGLCDRVLLVHHGKVISQGTPEEITGNFPRKLLEVNSENVTKLLDELSILMESGISFNRFGGSLHILYDTPEQYALIRRVLNESGHEAKEIRATVEDVFVLMMDSEQKETI